MRIHYLQHGSFDKPGIIAQWANQNGYPLSCTRTDQGESLPELDAFDLLVILDGQQSLLQIEKWPYLKNELGAVVNYPAGRRSGG